MEIPTLDKEGRGPGLVFAMRVEADAVLNAPLFKRSPTIAKLLRFLLEETLAGRAHQLKSYSVAVDGLGRAADYDIGDSYARVQMGRLRKMLQLYYAEHGPVDNLCLYLLSGSYSLRLAQLQTAYPTLYRPLSARPSAEMPAETPKEPVAEPNPRREGFSTWLSHIPASRTSLAIAALVVAAVALFLVWQTDRSTAQSRLSPVLELMPVETGGNAEFASVARIVSASFIDGMQRFKMSRIRVLDRGAVTAVPAGGEPVYRLHFQIMSGNGQMPKMFLRLNDMRANSLIWSRELDISLEPSAAHDAVAPLLAEINGPRGVIATHSTILYQDDNGGGYPCLMRYFNFLKSRDLASDAQVRECFEKPVREVRLRATILAARSLFATESVSARKSPEAAFKRSAEFAARAYAADPNDGSARFAMARMAYIKGDCVSARFFTAQTVEANSYSPIFMTLLASQAPQCEYDKADELFDKAKVLVRADDTDGRLLLVIAAIAQQRTGDLAALDRVDVPRTGRHRPNYYLTETAIAAAQDRPADARRQWQNFLRVLPVGANTPDAALRHTMLSDRMREQLTQFLAAHGVFAPSV